jgi:TonB family protein
MKLLFIGWVFLPFGLVLGQTPAQPQSASNAPPVSVPWQKEMALNVSGNKPVYPQIAQMAHVEGCVYVQLDITTDGSTKEAEVLIGPALMSQSAVESVRTWKFKPSAQEVTTVAPLCYFLSGDNPQRLLAPYEKDADKHSKDSGKIATLAHEFLSVGLAAEAENRFQQALSLKPNNPEIEFGLGDSLAAQGKLDGAISSYQQGISAKPKDAQARSRLAGLLQDNGDVNGAIAEYRTLLRGNLYDWNSHSKLAGLLLKTGDTDDAITEYKAALRYGAFDNAFAHYGLGQAYEKKGDTSDALKEYKKANDGMPQNTQFRDAYNRLSQK